MPEGQVVLTRWDSPAEPSSNAAHATLSWLGCHFRASKALRVARTKSPHHVPSRPPPTPRSSASLWFSFFHTRTPPALCTPPVTGSLSSFLTEDPGGASWMSSERSSVPVTSGIPSSIWDKALVISVLPSNAQSQAFRLSFHLSWFPDCYRPDGKIYFEPRQTIFVIQMYMLKLSLQKYLNESYIYVLHNRSRQAFITSRVNCGSFVDFRTWALFERRVRSWIPSESWVAGFNLGDQLVSYFPD